MKNKQNKSTTTIILDIIRNLITLILTLLILKRLLNWHWIASVIGAIPIYIVVLNIIGFATLPLYFFTPENKLLRKTSKAINNGDFENVEELNNLFDEKFKN